MNTSLGEKIGRLAEDLSLALAEYDEGAWVIKVKAAHEGVPIFTLLPAELSPTLRVEMNSKKIEQALAELRPGVWHREFDVNDGFLLFFRNDAKLTGLEDTLAKMETVSVRDT